MLPNDLEELENLTSTKISKKSSKNKLEDDIFNWPDSRGHSTLINEENISFFEFPQQNYKKDFTPDFVKNLITKDME